MTFTPRWTSSFYSSPQDVQGNITISVTSWSQAHYLWGGKSLLQTWSLLKHHETSPGWLTHCAILPSCCSPHRAALCLTFTSLLSLPPVLPSSFPPNLRHTAIHGKSQWPFVQYTAVVFLAEWQGYHWQEASTTSCDGVGFSPFIMTLIPSIYITTTASLHHFLWKIHSPITPCSYKHKHHLLDEP